MKERPIIFNADMVRAILDGRKTQTRRIMKPQPKPTPDDYYGKKGHQWPSKKHQSMLHVEGELQNGYGNWNGLASDACPFGAVGEHLWVRETFAVVPRTAYAHSDGVTQIKSPIDKDNASIYKADWCRSEGGIRWKPSIHMPRWASRIILQITNIRVERLQEINEQDASAEGCDYPEVEGMGWKFKPSFNFKFLWKKIYGQESLDANPWVWVIEFKVLTTNGVIGEVA
ncbi:hypothetical protein [Shewanella algae]|uniref:hypothetical protein n=1 Tax=Shewanella algae TaxID=38313 RepID=UPI0038B40130